MNSLRKLLIGGAMAGTALAGGAIGASLIGTASAQTPTTNPATEAPAQTGTPPASHSGQPRMGRGRLTGARAVTRPTARPRRS